MIDLYPGQGLSLNESPKNSYGGGANLVVFLCVRDKKYCKVSK